MTMTISSLVKYSWWPDTSINRTEQSEVITLVWFESKRPQRMRPRPGLHGTKAEPRPSTVRPRPGAQFTKNLTIILR